MNETNRVDVTDDEKKQLPVLPYTTQKLPQNGIYDGTLKYYAASLEWAPFIDGWMQWLTSASAWQDEVDESGFKISQIIKFIRGVDVIKDCNDVEECLTTSPTIAQIIADIIANDNDIAALQAADVSLQNQITANDNDIAALQAADVSLQNQINANIIAIGDNTNDIAALYAENDLQDATLIDHENRISALEAASSGGSGGATYDTKLIVTRELVQSIGWGSTKVQIDVDMPQGYDSVEMLVVATSDTAGSDYLMMVYNDDYTIANYQWVNGGSAFNQPHIAKIPSFSANPANQTVYPQIRIRWDNLLSQTWRVARGTWVIQNGTTGASGEQGDYGHVWENDSAITKVSFQALTNDIGANGFILVFGIKETEVCIPPVVTSPITVNFDGAWDDFIITNSGLSTQIDQIGNPDGCAVGTSASTVNGDYLGVKVDLLEERSIDSIRCDIWFDTGSKQIQLYADDVLIGQSAIYYDTFSTWHDTDGHATFDINDLFSAPLLATTVEIRLVDSDAGHPIELRVDNIEIAFS